MGPNSITTQGTQARFLHVLLVSFAIALPLAQELVPVILVGILVLAVWNFVKGDRQLHHWDIRSPYPWMILIYAFHLLGLFWTTNMDFAGLDLGIKAPLLVFPALVLLGTKVKDQRFVMRAFVISNAVAVGLCLFEAGYNSMVYALGVYPDPLSNYTLTVPFFASNFALFLHPTYMAMYSTVGLVLLSLEVVRAGWARTWVVLLGIALMIGVVLSASKAGWSVLLLLFILLAVSRSHGEHVRRWARIAIGVSLVVGVMLFIGTEFVRERIMQVVFAVSGAQSDMANSSNDRLQIWDAALTLIREHPVLGAGTGDVKDVLLDQYAAKGYSEPLEKQLNAHDQFLNTGVALGVGASILLLVMLLLPMFTAQRAGRWVPAIFLLITFLNWTVESMLEVQAGVMFFAFFTWLFWEPTAVPAERRTL